MRKLFLAHFSFTTGKVEFNDQRLLVLHSKEFVPNEGHEVTATRKAMEWFRISFQESELHSCMCFDAIDEITHEHYAKANECEIHNDEVKRNLNKSHESILKKEWFGLDEFPKKYGSGEVSDDVLIDLTGDRKQYAIGYVAFDSEGDEWLFYHDTDYTSIIDYKNAKWTYLPLLKYDNK